MKSKNPFYAGYSNVSFPDLIVGSIKFFVKYPLQLFNFYRSYYNYWTVIYNSSRGEYPIDAILRNGEPIKMENKRVSKLPWHKVYKDNIINGLDYSIKFNLQEETAIIWPKSHKDKKRVKLLNCINNGDVWAIFVQDDYKKLPVSNRSVIDIGANIGDSSIYFALQGANRVIALEPFIRNYKMAKENIEINKLGDTINLLLAGSAGSTRVITIPTMQQTNLQDDFTDGTQISIPTMQQTNLQDDFTDGTRIQLYNLKNLMDLKHVIGEAVLKMDCEGCEYETILSANNDILRRFSYILIEYHYGYRNLKKKLQSCGFIVSVTPTKIDDPNTIYIGTIFASRL